MLHTSLILTLPVWIESFLNHYSFPLTSEDSRMRMVIAMAEENSNRKTGGPFAAAVFNSTSGDIIACGVNRVIPCACSLAHAEMMALGLAQHYFDSYDLSAPDLPELELVTSTEPCAMCLGAIPWSGIRRIICGATDTDARNAGFDEGTKPEPWIEALKKRGITVRTEICREDAVRVLEAYAEKGGAIYNGSCSRDDQ